VCLLVCFLFSYRDPSKKTKKIHIFHCPITLRATNFVSVTLLSLCPSWLSIVAGWIRVLSFSILLRALFVPLTDSTFPNINRSNTLIGLPSLAALRELSLRQP
jgi:hypothetical protein